MVSKLRGKGEAAAVAAIVLSCNFLFPSFTLYVVLFNDSPDDRGFQRLFLYSDSVLRVRVLSQSTFRHAGALIQIPSVPNVIEANHSASTAASFGRKHS